jgi:hypothetical protein
MRQDWAHLLFLHWPLAPESVQQRLPAGLQVDTFQDRAYVSLVPFTIRNVHPPLLPPLPWLSRFHEVNLRTYVHHDGHGPGVWFFSLDATSPLAVAGARAWYRLKYYLARIRMRIESADPQLPSRVDYDSRRIFPGPRSSGCSVRYGPRGTAAEAKPGTLEHFLIERYLLYSESSGRLRQARVSHSPYVVYPAAFDNLQDSLSVAAGLAGPGREILAHYSRGVSVRIHAPHAVR